MNISQHAYVSYICLAAPVSGFLLVGECRASESEPEKTWANLGTNEKTQVHQQEPSNWPGGSWKGRVPGKVPGKVPRKGSPRRAQQFATQKIPGRFPGFPERITKNEE